MDPTMTTDPLLARLRQLSWPTPPADHLTPEAGQLWRAAWLDAVCLVVILAAPSERTLEVAAASADEAGDDQSVTVETTSGLRPVVWAGVTGRVPVFTLDCRLGDLTPTSLERLLSVARAGSGDWAPVEDLDDRALIRAEIADRLDELVDADWLPGAAAGDDLPTLAEAAETAGVPASAVAARLNITPGDARRLLHGRREATAPERELLAGLIGQATERVSYDEDMVVELDQPEFRPALHRLALADHGGDEVAARRSKAGELMAMAARQRTPGTRNWKALVRDALRHD